ncbi:hypothetical protein ACH4UT_33760 [Streptomyces sp. NPDC020799]|uniref:hypothetical protein n=1 Tax=Streptomyces sp. NPDC020799 TaxID=3365091 RepID=UPI00379194BE
MSRIHDIRLAGWAGIIPVFTIAFYFTASGTLEATPPLDSPSAHLQTFVQQSHIAMTWQVGVSLTLVLYLWFTAGLIEATHVPGQSQIPARLVGWGAATVMALSCCCFAVYMATAFQGELSVNSPDLIRALLQASVLLATISYGPMALLLLGGGLLLRRSRVLPSWLATSALVLAPLIGLLTFTVPILHGPLASGTFISLTVGMVLFTLWVTAAGIALVRWSYRAQPTLPDTSSDPLSSSHAARMDQSS